MSWKNLVNNLKTVPFEREILRIYFVEVNKYTFLCVFFLSSFSFVLFCLSVKAYPMLHFTICSSLSKLGQASRIESKTSVQPCLRVLAYITQKVKDSTFPFVTLHQCFQADRFRGDYELDNHTKILTKFDSINSKRIIQQNYPQMFQKHFWL